MPIREQFVGMLFSLSHAIFAQFTLADTFLNTWPENSIAEFRDLHISKGGCVLTCRLFRKVKISQVGKLVYLDPTAENYNLMIQDTLQRPFHSPGDTTENAL